MANRIFVEKRPEFRSEAESLRRELNTTLGLNLKELRLVAVYDLFGFTPELIESTRYAVFGEIEERGGALNVRDYCNWRKAVQGFRRR